MTAIRDIFRAGHAAARRMQNPEEYRPTNGSTPVNGKRVIALSSYSNEKDRGPGTGSDYWGGEDLILATDGTMYVWAWDRSEHSDAPKTYSAKLERATARNVQEALQRNRNLLNTIQSLGT